MTTAPSSPDLSMDAPPLPGNIWAPEPDASIEICWSDPVEGFIDVAVLLLDRAIVTRNASNLIARRLLSIDSPCLVFSLRNEYTGQRILWGQIEWRFDADGGSNLWLLDAGYPGGHTASARIAGPFQEVAHGRVAP